MYLEIKQIDKQYGSKTILRNLHLDLRTGETVGIFGRNGTGKSTMMKILFGTLKANVCSVLIDGLPFEVGKNIEKRMIAYPPQESFLPRDIKVRNLIPMVLRDGDKQNRVFYAPGVANFEKQWVGTLSHGNLKYLEFLLIAHMPHPFLLLDEPFSMIDPLYHDVIKEMICSLKKDKGILLTDHYYHDVWQVADRNVVLSDESTQAIETKADLATYGYLTDKKNR
jgi:ABC-type multidrug transport system ATPase subunit